MPHEDNRTKQDPTERLHPTPLPPALAAFLRDQGYHACVTQATDQGTAFIVRAPAAEIARAGGTVPMHVRHQLFGYPTGPVIRTVLTLYDYPNEPLRFESFTNVAVEEQRAAFAAFGDQDHHLMLFYDENLDHQLTKMIPAGLDNCVGEMLARAERLRAAIPDERYDFDRAKAALMSERE